MPDFNRSQLKVFGRDGSERPFRTGFAPPGGVFILLSDAIVDYMRATMSQAEKDRIAPWIERYDVNDADPLKRPQTWNVSIWAGETSGVVLHIPNATWADPTTTPPLAVRNFFRALWS